jgi:hypothetical protein
MKSPGERISPQTSPFVSRYMEQCDVPCEGKKYSDKNEQMLVYGPCVLRDKANPYHTQRAEAYLA